MSTPGKDEQGISFNIEVSALASIESIIVSMFVFVCVCNFKFKPALIFFFFVGTWGSTRCKDNMFSPYRSCVELERKHLLIQMSMKEFHLDLASVLSIKGAISHQSRASVFNDLVMRLNSPIFSHRNACCAFKISPISSLLSAVFWSLQRTISLPSKCFNLLASC